MDWFVVCYWHEIATLTRISVPIKTNFHLRERWQRSPLAFGLGFCRGMGTRGWKRWQRWIIWKDKNERKERRVEKLNVQNIFPKNRMAIRTLAKKEKSKKIERQKKRGFLKKRKKRKKKWEWEWRMFTGFPGRSLGVRRSTVIPIFNLA